MSAQCRAVAVRHLCDDCGDDARISLIILYHCLQQVALCGGGTAQGAGDTGQGRQWEEGVQTNRSSNGVAVWSCVETETWNSKINIR